MRRALLPCTALVALSLLTCLPRVGEPLDGGGGGSGSGGGGGSGGSCTDGLLNGTESDVDCGGVCPACTVNLACRGPLDCASGLCARDHCAVPARACPPAFAGCVTFTNLTDAGAAEVRFPNGGERYAPKCVRVKFGQQLTFTGGSFSFHPLNQGCGPSSGLLVASTGTSTTVVFDQALGVYGYYCSAHGSSDGSGMAGAVEVVR